jgi:hypothetical protein
MKRFPLAALSVILFSPTASFACDEMREMRMAMQAAQNSTKEARQAAYQKAYDEAWAAKGLMEQFLDLAYFPGVWDMKTGDVTLTGSAGAAYSEIAAFAKFLPAAGTKATLKQADREFQFGQLKAYYKYALGRAGDKLRELDLKPAQDQKVSSLSDWGAQSNITGGKHSGQILTHEERAMILRATPPEPRDPRE